MSRIFLTIVLALISSLPAGISAETTNSAKSTHVVRLDSKVVASGHDADQKNVDSELVETDVLKVIKAPKNAGSSRIEISNLARETVPLELDWRFHLGDLKGAEILSFDDSNWRLVDVPHDWSIEGEYRKDNPAGNAGGFLPTGIGWYRKHLDWNPSWSGKHVIIEFDGVYMNSDVWINGGHVGNRPYGYSSFSYDITEHLQDGDNVISVRVDHSRAPSGRWYTGSGIYRHVRLTTVQPIHIPKSGSFVRFSNVSKDSATLQLDTEVINQTAVEAQVLLESKCLAPDGSIAATTSSTQTIPSGATIVFKQQAKVANPQRWSPDSPSMYVVQSTVVSGEKIVDQLETRTGIRSLEFSAVYGFLLNNQPVLIKGICMHHDAGPVGAAVPDDVLRTRLSQIKAMGANAIRTSHNPFAPEFYAMADEIGLMVMDEAFDGWWKTKANADYGLYFNDWWKRDLADFIRRDRNHPSVIMWSIGNEVKEWDSAKQKMITDFIRQLDPTRPITQGEGAHGGHLDIAGFNGHGEFLDALEEFHKENPKLPLIGTEITHTLQSRGVYRTKTSYRVRDNPAPWERKNPEKKWEQIKDRVYKVPDFTEKEVFTKWPRLYQSSYDNSIVRMNVRDEIRLAKKLPYFIGTFRWTGFDYLGESFNWPARTANFGIIDLAGFEKDAYYLYQSQWSGRPMVHLLPHWTHPGLEGTEIPVVAYTNLESAELFLNGKSLGEKSMTDELQIVWMVPYQPGELRVVAKSPSGGILDETIHTAKDPHAVQLNANRAEMTANRRDVARIEVNIVDEASQLVPNASNLVSFTIDGPGRLIGVENGDILDLAPHKVNYRKSFQGKCMVLVQASDVKGEIVVTASSPGLATAVVRIKTESP